MKVLRFRPGTNDLWASGDSNIGLRIVNLATGNSVQQVAVSGSVEAMAWNLDGSVLYFIKNVDGSGISDLYKYVPGDGVTLLCEDPPSEIEAMENGLPRSARRRSPRRSSTKF